MGIFNSKIKNENSNLLNNLQDWSGTGSSSIGFRDPYEDRLQQNKNFSNNDLDFTRPKWWQFKGKGLRYSLEHRNDNIPDTGYEYRGMVLRNTISKSFFLEFKRRSILDQYEILIDWLIDQVKSIKKAYNFMLEKDYRDFN